MPESTEGVAVGATTAMDYENAADSTENDAEAEAESGGIIRRMPPHWMASPWRCLRIWLS